MQPNLLSVNLVAFKIFRKSGPKTTHYYILAYYLLNVELLQNLTTNIAISQYRLCFMLK